MKCVLLAAGYATRLYPLTLNLPKSLLSVAGRTILDRILEKVDGVPEIDEVILVSNSRFADQFARFLSGRKSRIACSVLDDGTSDNETRLGAIADLLFAVDRRCLDGDLMVLAGDNLFDFRLSDFATFFHEKGADCITAHRLENQAELRRTGVAELDSDSRVLSFQEKPAVPRSTWAVPPFYLYRRETLPLIREYLEGGGNPDAPGNLIPWLAARRPVYAFTFSGRRWDIGNAESYEEAKRAFEGR
jgi:glucose-1-phosphate thymidylyltransferase